MGSADRWTSGKSDAQRGKTLGVVKERRQILIVQQRRKSAVESKFEVKRSRTTSRRKGWAQTPCDRTAPSKETKERHRRREERGKEGEAARVNGAESRSFAK